MRGRHGRSSDGPCAYHSPGSAPTVAGRARAAAYQRAQRPLPAGRAAVERELRTQPILATPRAGELALEDRLCDHAGAAAVGASTGYHALGDVPDVLVAVPADDADAAREPQDVEHPPDVLRCSSRRCSMVPARGPRCSATAAARAAEGAQHVVAEPWVRREPRTGVAASRGRLAGVAAHRAPVQRVVGRRHQVHPVLEQLAVMERRPLEGLDVVAAEPAPQHEPLGACHRVGRVDLDRSQMGRRRDQVGRLRCGQQLGADGQPTGLCRRELEHARRG